MKPHPPWWQQFQVVAYVVAGLTAAGTAVVFASKYLTLPQRVEAGETKNAQQDKQLDRLIALQEFYAQQPPNVQQRPRSRTFSDHKKVFETRPFREEDEDKVDWCCWELTEEDCDKYDTWEPCEE